jgi:hypothetical protein
MGVSQFAVFMVGKAGSAGGYGVTFLGNGDGAPWNAATSGMAFYMDGSNTNLANYRNGSARASATVVAASQHRFASVFRATGTLLYVDGVAGTPVAYNAALAATGQIAVGDSNVSGAPWDQPEGEIVWVKVALTTQQLADMDAYFAGRW